MRGKNGNTFLHRHCLLMEPYFFAFLSLFYSIVIVIIAKKVLKISSVDSFHVNYTILPFIFRSFSDILMLEDCYEIYRTQKC